MPLWSRLVDLRVGSSIGFALFALSLLSYRSYASRPVLGIWSYAFFALVALVYAGLAVWIFRALLTARATRSGKPTGAAVSVELAMLFWGTAFCIATLEDHNNAGRVTDLDFFGSIAPIPSILEWFAMCLLALAILLVARSRLGVRHANVMVSVAATVLALLAVEGGFRVYFALAPMVQGFPTNASLSWARRYVSINSLGWRDSEHALAADPSVSRLLVVGDSYAYGDGIRRREDRFGEQIVARLTEQTGQAWESMNASKAGSNTLGEIEFLRKALPYRPRVVLLLYVFNDIDYLRMVIPDVKSSRISPFGVLFSNSHLFQQAYLLFVRLYVSARVDHVAVYEDDELVSRHLVDIKRFVALAGSQGAQVFVVPMDSGVAITGEPRAGHKNFLRLADEAGIPVISALEVLKGLEFRDVIVNSFDHHPNERAYRVAAAHVGGELHRRLLEREP